jgi:hypothetical protein
MNPILQLIGGKATCFVNCFKFSENLVKPLLEHLVLSKGISPSLIGRFLVELWPKENHEYWKILVRTKPEPKSEGKSLSEIHFCSNSQRGII